MSKFTHATLVDFLVDFVEYVDHVVVRPLVYRRRVRARLLQTLRPSRSATLLKFLTRHLQLFVAVLLRLRTRLKRRKHEALSPEERHADALDAIGRELRLGSSLHAAVIAAVDRCAITEWKWLAQASSDGASLGEVVRLSTDDNSSHLALRAIAVASEGGDGVLAVGTAARSLRLTAAIAAESRTAVAHTKSSMAVLTWVPLALATWLVLRDAGARAFFGSTAGVLCVLFGTALQWVGRRSVARLTTAATRVDSALADFVDVITVHLRSGQPPALAFIQASTHATSHIGEAAQRVVGDVRDGNRFVDALTTHRHTFGLRAQPLIDALIDTERDGLSPHALFDRIATDAHMQRRRDADLRVRALPVRLTLPLVGCILPAYILLAVLPLLASQLSSVFVDLP